MLASYCGGSAEPAGIHPLVDLEQHHPIEIVASHQRSISNRKVDLLT